MTVINLFLLFRKRVALLYALLFLLGVPDMKGQSSSEISNLPLPGNLKLYQYVHDVILISGRQTNGANLTCSNNNSIRLSSRMSYLVNNFPSSDSPVRFMEATNSDGSDLGLNKYWFVIKDASQNERGFMLMNAASKKILKIGTKVVNGITEPSLIEVDYLTSDANDQSIYFTMQQLSTNANALALANGKRCIIAGTVMMPSPSPGAFVPYPAFLALWHGVLRDNLTSSFYDPANSNLTTDYSYSISGKSYLLSRYVSLDDCSASFRYENIVVAAQSIYNLTGFSSTPIPFQNIQNTTVSNGTISYNGSNGQSGKAISSIGLALGIPEQSTEVKFIGTSTSGEVGYINYLYNQYDASSMQKLKIRCGLKQKNNQIVLFYNNTEVVTGFTANTPVILGLAYPDSLIAIQNGVKKHILGIPVQYFADVNLTQTIRMATVLSSGSVEVKYTPGRIFFPSSNFGTTPPALTNTDLDMPQNPKNPTYVNTFDWRAAEYQVRIKENGQVSTVNLTSPFRYTNEEYSAISAKYSPTGIYLSGEDNESAGGWELIKADLGYNADGTEKPLSSVLEYPYFIMYNRLTSVMRVFTYLKNASISNNLQISLEATTSTGSVGAEKLPALWSTNLQFKALNDPSLSIADYTKLQKLNVNSGQFYFADFMMTYDPCIAFFESSIRLKVDYITQGDLKLVGRSLSSSIPAGTAQYGNLINTSKNFMAGALKTPYGSQANTLGDLTFNSLSEANVQEYSNAITGILEGKKIDEWRKQAAKLRMEAGFTNATGETLDAAGTLAEGVAKLATAADITNISTKAAEASGKLISAAGKFMKASAAYVNASALKLEYDAIRNKDKESDQQIKLTAPEPRVSMVMGELALSGNVTITTPVFDNVYITTPGSKNAELAPEYFNNGSKGGQPLYNEPMGSTTLLFKPEFDVAVKKNSSTEGLGVYLKTKKRPYVAINDRSTGKMQNVIGVSVFVNTYNGSGVLVNTAYTDPVSMDLLDGNMDITPLIDKQAFLANYNALTDQSATNVTTQLAKWLKIGYILINYSPSKLVQQSGALIIGASNTHYEGAVAFRFESDATTTSPLNGAIIMANTYFAGTTFQNDATMGTNYRISNMSTNFNALMQNYCNASSSSRTMGASSDPSDKLIETDSDQLSSGNSVLVYPNPSNGSFNVKYQTRISGNVQFTLYSMQGVMVIEATNEHLTANRLYTSKIDMPGVREGIYLLRIVYPDGNSESKKLIVK